jgi:hypothetical protein
LIRVGGLRYTSRDAAKTHAARRAAGIGGGTDVSREIHEQPGGHGARPAGEARTLDSWKEIANFLGVSVRTAHRWEEGAGMPVHRSPAGHVSAEQAALDRWRRDRPKRDWRRWLVPGGLTLVAIVVAAFLLLPWRSDAVGVPATVTFEGQKVLVLDQDGRTRWSTSIPHLGFSGEWGWEVSTPDRFLVADVDHDGAVEVLLNVLADSATDRPGRLICYSQDGRVRWEFVLGRGFKDRYGEYAQNYLGHILRAISIKGKPYVLSIATHRRWNPCQVALLDPSTGTVIEQFWHPGAITHAILADLDGDGAAELVLAGLNNPGNGPGSPVLMALRLPFSATPPSAASLMAEMSDGGPIAYIVFPRPDVLAAQGGVSSIQKLVFEEPATVLVHTRYTRDMKTILTYRFDSGLRLRDFFAPIELAAAHDMLWRAGALTHRFGAQEQAWLQGVRSYSMIPDGNRVLVPPFRPGN